MNPSLALLPCAFDTSKLYSVLPEDGTGDFTVSRNGTAAYLGADGLLKTALANEPRLEFNPDGSFKGVLVEPAATNLITRSEDFINGWIRSALTLVANQGISPNGNNIATKVSISIDSSAARHRVYPALPTSITSGVTYTGSFFLKKGNHRWIQLIYVNSTAFSVNSWANFDLENGVLGTVGSNATARIENVGNGWYRCSLTTTAIATVSSTTGCEIVTTNNQNSGRYPLYQSTIAEDVCFVWGAQLEVGSISTSYIPTDGSTVTRPADVIQRTNAQNLVGQGEGSIYVEVNYNNVSTSEKSLIELNINGSNNGLFRIGITSTNRIQVAQTLKIGGPSIWLFSNNIVRIGLNKIVLVYKNGQSPYVIINGIKYLHTIIAPNVTDFIFDGFTRIDFGSARNLAYLNDNIKSVTLLKTALTDAQAIALTTL